MTEAPLTNPNPSVSERVMKLAQQVKLIHSVVQIAGRYSVDIQSSALDDFYSLTKEHLRNAANGAVNDKTIVVSVDFGLRMTPKAEENQPPAQPVVEIFATFLASYDFAEPIVADDDVLFAFAEINGRFNLTSYWREYLQNCLSRASLPTVEVPPFNARRAMSELDKSDRAVQSSPVPGSTKTKAD